MTQTHRVLIADDHEEFRRGLEALLAATPSVEVVGTAADGAMAVALALDLQPDVVLMDLHMPRVNGVEATAQITRSSPHIGVLVLTMMEDEASVFDAVRAGARGYLLKGARRGEIVRAVEAVGAGEVIFGPGIADRMMGYFSSVRARPVDGAFPELTDRERVVLGLIAEGKENGEIARQLDLSVKTVRNHASNIFAKLQVAHRAQAIVKAREAGLGSDRPAPPDHRRD
jgi:DNA-binding NarL/FixJ family response regulator